LSETNAGITLKTQNLRDLCNLTSIVEHNKMKHNITR